MNFAQRLKDLRNNKGLSQSALADILGRTQQAIGKWEVGKAEPDSTTLLKLANYFNVTTDYLLGLSDNPHGLQQGLLGDINGDSPLAQKAREGTADITPYEKALIDAYRLANERDKTIVNTILKPNLQSESQKSPPAAIDITRNKWIQPINEMYDGYYPLIDKLDAYADFDRQQEEYACLLEHPKMRNLFEAVITNHELRVRVPADKGKKDTISEALACMMVTEFDTFQADYMVPPDGETYLIKKLKEYIP